MAVFVCVLVFIVTYVFLFPRFSYFTSSPLCTVYNLQLEVFTQKNFVGDLTKLESYLQQVAQLWQRDCAKLDTLGHPMEASGEV